MAVKGSGNDAASARDDDAKMLAPAAGQGITKTVDKGVRDCQRTHYKKFKGNLEIKYQINPDGKAEDCGARPMIKPLRDDAHTRYARLA